MNWPQSSLPCANQRVCNFHLCNPQFTYCSIDTPILFLLRRRREEHLLLQYHWRTPLASDTRFQSQTSRATRLANQYSGVSDVAPIHWVYVNIQQATEYDGSEPESWDEEADGEACIIEDTYDAMLGEDGNYEDSPSNPCGLVPATVPTDLRQVIERDLWLFDLNPVSMGYALDSSLLSCIYSISSTSTLRFRYHLSLPMHQQRLQSYAPSVPRPIIPTVFLSPVLHCSASTRPMHGSTTNASISGPK